MLEGDFSIDVLRCIAAHVSPRTAEAQTLSNFEASGCWHVPARAWAAVSSSCALAVGMPSLTILEAGVPAHKMHARAEKCIRLHSVARR